MTVKELIEILQQEPQDSEIICDFLTIEGLNGYPIIGDIED